MHQRPFTVSQVQTVSSLSPPKEEELEGPRLAMMVIMVLLLGGVGWKWQTHRRKPMQYGFSKKIPALLYRRINNLEPVLIQLSRIISRRLERRQELLTLIRQLMILIRTRSPWQTKRVPTGTMRLRGMLRSKVIIYQ